MPACAKPSALLQMGTGLRQAEQSLRTTWLMGVGWPVLTLSLCSTNKETEAQRGHAAKVPQEAGPQSLSLGHGIELPVRAFGGEGLGRTGTAITAKGTGSG